MILAIDLGSTSFKAAVVDQRLRLHGYDAREVRYQFGDRGRVELRTAEAAAALRQSIEAALASARLPARKLHAVAVTSQAQTFTLLSQRDRAQIPFITWQDSRAVRACESLKERSQLPDVGRHCSFGSLIPPLQICQLVRLRKMQPSLLAAAKVVSLPTYFVQHWCGVAAVDENLAAMSGLYSLMRRTWWPAALNLCGLRVRQLPAVLPIGAIAGYTGRRATTFGLCAGLPVILAGNDQTAGAYAARLEENHGLLLTLGTAQAAYICSDRMPRPRDGLFRGPYPGRSFYRMAADGCGGGVINWAKTILAGAETDKRFFDLATRSSSGCHGLVFHPDVGTSKGSWSRLGFHHTPADLARAVLESLSRRMAGLIRELGVRVDSIPVFVTGGGSENAAWVRILSETLGVKLKTREGRPCVGAARLAWKTLGKTRD